MSYVQTAQLFMKTIIFDFDGTIVDLRSKKALVSRADLIDLKKDYKLALVTGSPQWEVDEVFGDLDWEGIFEIAICKDNKGSDKSTGLPFIKILQETGGPAVVIGDGDSDREGAKVANIDFIRVEEGEIGTAIRGALEIINS